MAGPVVVKRPCSWPGCPVLVDRGRCEMHRRQERKAIDERRGSAHERGYDHRWQRARAAYLREHPLCVHCRKQGRVTAASVVDHIKPHKGNKALFWDQGNWQGLCVKHHNQKTNSEDGGFGNAPTGG